jgi:hypothetical protein
MVFPTLHTFPEGDSTSVFVHKGKEVAPRLLQRKSEFIEAFMGQQKISQTTSWINKSSLHVTCMDPPN